MTVMMKAREAADEVYESVRIKIDNWNKAGITPCIATILVEGDPASAYYAQAKNRMADKLGIRFELHSLPQDVQEDVVIQLVKRLNDDRSIHGIMLELPLPKQLSASRLESIISPLKDVDGVTPVNKLATLTGAEGLYPATPQACIQLLKHYGYSLEGRNVTLVGRGQTVGLPLFHMLQRENATVTVCHSRTPDIAFHLRHAEIAFVAVGRPNMIKKEMVHSELAIIDAGINELNNGTITGDVEPEAALHAAALSPVPGGVGTLTTAILFENLTKAVSLQHREVPHP
ncbi:bifunctional 5,10-methylenetetrahydrofolate dehydrogenase/5,10-methenyltetrahydrofolate cyclohydrolase [Paenibacillus kobensis]|uniref:bifunctional 5,10-methylenetetrahydrofolate dehydrogenase/5,10-methenyltetrahydrofolate cyclohydrolase n=1 Tax=Paenibacillus kobensis TaxID=59841 RepID=UPI000FD745D4|nr:bifunctional 5,10-methylenetetrahydrofolate dehydrogenase/5,10-methenyltetrahydrofolate cyclohydrolase [Paenibacillus kobensis]